VARNAEVPAYAVRGGHEAKVKVLYVARFFTKKSQLPPEKLNPYHGVGVSFSSIHKYSYRTFLTPTDVFLDEKMPEKSPWIF
jgi:hypothetical protein